MTQARILSDFAGKVIIFLTRKIRQKVFDLVVLTKHNTGYYKPCRIINYYGINNIVTSHNSPFEMIFYPVHDAFIRLPT